MPLNSTASHLKLYVCKIELAIFQAVPHLLLYCIVLIYEVPMADMITFFLVVSLVPPVRSVISVPSRDFFFTHRVVVGFCFDGSDFM